MMMMMLMTRINFVKRIRNEATKSTDIYDVTISTGNLVLFGSIQKSSQFIEGEILSRRFVIAKFSTVLCFSVACARAHTRELYLY